MKTARIITATLIMVYAGVLSAQSQSPLKDRSRHPPRMPVVAPFGPGAGGAAAHGTVPVMLDVEELRDLLTGINISKTTIDKAVVIVREFIKEFEAKIIKVQREELGVREELLKEKPDLRAIEGCINRKSQIFAQIELSQIKRDLDIKSLLTPDEYDRWRAAAKKWMKEMLPADMGEGGGSSATSGARQPKIPR